MLGRGQILDAAVRIADEFCDEPLELGFVDRGVPDFLRDGARTQHQLVHEIRHVGVARPDAAQDTPETMSLVASAYEQVEKECVRQIGGAAATE